MPLTDAMRADYEAKFAACTLRPEMKDDAEEAITRMLKNRNRYQTVADATHVPWYVVAVIHTMECSGRFDCHLHNGDPLTARTVDVPRGRPAAGAPPFSWEFSAEDALRYDGFDAWRDWSVAGALFKLEAYNGMGYRLRAHIATPYLWSGCQFYTSGKFVRDGIFDREAKSEEVGAAVLLRRMVDQHVIELPEIPAAAPPAAVDPAAVDPDPKCEGEV